MPLNKFEALKIRLIALSSCFGHQSSVFRPKKTSNLASDLIVDNQNNQLQIFKNAVSAA